jgi:hypothetical protein
MMRLSSLLLCGDDEVKQQMFLLSCGDDKIKFLFQVSSGLEPHVGVVLF